MKVHKITRLLLTISLLMFSSVSAFADFQSWNNLTVIGSFKKQYKYWLEVQGRFGSNVSRLSQSILRSAVGCEVDSANSLWFGYAWIYTTVPFARLPTDENRIWQQYVLKHDFDKKKLIARSRLEQRFIERRSKVGWRFRQGLKVEYNLTKVNDVFLAASDEVFFNLNNTSSSGSDRGFDQNRLFVGVGYKPMKSWQFEFGYQHHLVNKARGPNYTGNYIVVNLLGTLK